MSDKKAVVDDEDIITNKIFNNREELNKSLFRLNRSLFLLDTKARIEYNWGIDPNYKSIQKVLESCLSLLAEAQCALEQEISK